MSLFEEGIKEPFLVSFDIDRSISFFNNDIDKLNGHDLHANANDVEQKRSEEIKAQSRAHMTKM
jgi:hypothetical protein